MTEEKKAQTPAEALDRLQLLKEEISSAHDEKDEWLQEWRDSLPAEMKIQLQEIEEAHAERLAPLLEEAKQLEASIKEATLKIGSTQKGQFLQAVWSTGKTKWDTAGLANAGKEEGREWVLNYRSFGDPSISIRKAAAK